MKPRNLLFACSIVAGLAIGGVVAQENPYVRKEPVLEEAQRTCPESPLEFQPSDCWVGQRVLFLPKTNILREYGYSGCRKDGLKFYKPEAKVSYAEAVGKIGIVEAVEKESVGYTARIKVDEIDRILLCRVIGSSVLGRDDAKEVYIEDVVFLAEIDAAREKWLGKTLWYTGSALILSNLDTGQSKSVTIKKYSPVKVSDVSAGQRHFAPISFLVETVTGDKGAVDVTISGTNTGSLGHLSPFEKEFMEVDPRTLHDWSDRAWQAIEQGKVFVGMTDEQAKMSWGEPSDINRTYVAGTNHEQWVYGDQYLYFEDGLLTSFQD